MTTTNTTITVNTTPKTPASPFRVPAALPRIKFTAKRSLAGFFAVLTVCSAIPFASAASSPIASGESFAIQTVLSNDSYVLNEQFALGNGGRGVLDPWNGESNEVFTFTLVAGTDYYRITPRHNTNLALRGGSSAGSQVTFVHYTGGWDCQWKVEQVGNQYMLKNRSSGLYLDVQNALAFTGANMTVYYKNSSNAQKFDIFPAEPGHLLEPNNVYELLAPGSLMGVNVQFAPTSGVGKLCLDSTSNHEKNEQFILRYHPAHNAYSLHPVYRQDAAINCLYGKDAPAGSQAVIHPFTEGDTASLWRVSRCGKNYRFESVAKPGFFLDIAHGGRSAGTRINIWSDDHKNQTLEAKFVRSAGDSAPAPSPAPTPAPVANTSMTNALYGINTTASKLTCGFDGYVDLKNQYGYRHEGIDFQYNKNQAGQAVHSLTDGVVTASRIDEKSGLSTVAVYYAAANKTVVYLHLTPTISKDATVKRGQQIGTEAARGAGGVIHTHVEVRDGRMTGAAVSKDSTLANANPTAFWNSLGYTVK